MNLDTMIYPSVSTELTIRMLITPGHSFPATTRNGIILHGPFGTGKSTCAKLLPPAIEARYSAQTPNVRYENCMPGNNGVGLIESIHNQSKSYPTSGSFHYVILDEADNLTSDAMKQLSLSEILCVRHSMSTRSMNATQDQTHRFGGPGGTAAISHPGRAA